MKTKLFLFVAVLLTAFSINAQINTVAVVGNSVGGWPGEGINTGLTDIHQMTRVTPGGDDWTVTTTVTYGVPVSPGIKFRANNSWADAPVGYNWGAIGWKTGIGTINGPNIIPLGTAGSSDVYVINFNSTTGAYSFIGGPVIPVVKVVGTAVADPAGVAMTYLGSDSYELTTDLVVGGVQFNVDGTSNGSIIFPDGDALSPTESTPIATAKSYKITYNVATGSYTFRDGIKKISVVGGSTPIGWGFSRLQEDTQTLVNKNNGNENYYFGELPLTVPATDGGLKFRRDNAWADAIGGVTFPTGIDPTAGNIIVDVPGTYSVNLVRSTGAYEFFISKITLIGDAIGGWTNAAELPLTSVDGGINYTRPNVVVVANDGCKFRLDNDYAKAWGSTAFPSGTSSPSTGANISAMMGTYDVRFNRVTGDFAFMPVGSLAAQGFNKSNLSIANNPTSTSWKIASTIEISSVEVVNILGKVVYSNNTAANEFNVDATALTNGVYFAKISSRSAVETVKLVKN